MLRSDDPTTWEHQGLVLDRPGSRPDDGTIGLHEDVVVRGDTAYVFYFTHPGRTGTGTVPDDGIHATRRARSARPRSRVTAPQTALRRGSLCLWPIPGGDGPVARGSMGFGDAKWGRKGRVDGLPMLRPC